MTENAPHLRWFWPGILAIPALGLIAQEAWTLSNLSLDGSVIDQLMSAAGWAGWVASPFVVVGAAMAVAVWRRTRAGWWVAVVGGAATVLAGLLIMVLALFDPSTDPLTGLYQVLAPLLQLGPASATGIIVLVLAFVSTRQSTTQPPTDQPVDRRVRGRATARRPADHVEQ